MQYEMGCTSVRGRVCERAYWEEDTGEVDCGRGRNMRGWEPGWAHPMGARQGCVKEGDKEGNRLGQLRLGGTMRPPADLCSGGEGGGMQGAEGRRGY